MNTDKAIYIQKMAERTRLFFSESELEKIRETKTAIAGFGGVGAIATELLARMGVERFRLLDKDKYEPSNLNRQLFATSSTLGAFKAKIAAERIKEINPFAEIEMVITERIDNVNAENFVKGSDIVIQTTDTPSSKLLYEAARKFKVPLVNGYSTGTGGKVQVFDYRHSNCLCLIESIKEYIKWKNKKKPVQMTREELDEMDRQLGQSVALSIGFVTNVVGCLIVAEAIKLITGRGKVCRYPKQIHFDLFNLNMKIKNMYSLWDLENYIKFLKLIGDRK